MSKKLKKLPKIEDSKPIEVTFLGYPVTVRKTRVGDSTVLARILSNSDDDQWYEEALAVVAQLMVGYEGDYERRLEWLKSIEYGSVTKGMKQAQKDLIEIMQKTEFIEKKKEKKKSTKSKKK